jgi:hypothetical protein
MPGSSVLWECSGSAPLLISRVVVLASSTSATERNGLYEGQAQEFHEWKTAPDVGMVSRKWSPQRSPREHPATPKDTRTCYPHPPSCSSHQRPRYRQVIPHTDLTIHAMVPGSSQIVSFATGLAFSVAARIRPAAAGSVWSITPDVLAFLVYEQAHRGAAKRPRLEL